MTRGKLEKALVERDGVVIVGVDEVGRGCIAGPVYAACVILDFAKLHLLAADEKNLLRDSKTLSAGQRQKALSTIQTIAIEIQSGHASVREIETLGIQPATFLAMRRALNNCQQPFNLVLVDGNRPINDIAWKQMTVIKGDNLCYSIAAASIVAKETRDQFMREQDLQFPDYGFASHVGYGTKEHLAAIARSGICTLHRRNFAPISKVYGRTETSHGTATI